MKNYWLDKKNKSEFISTGEFEQAVINYRFEMAKPDGNKAEATAHLHHCFKILVGAIVRFGGFDKMSGLDHDTIIQEGLLVCHQKQPRYNPFKGKAFNYFTTVVLGHLRQMYRSRSDYKTLKEKYEELLARKKGE